MPPFCPTWLECAVKGPIGPWDKNVLREFAIGLKPA